MENLRQRSAQQIDTNRKFAVQVRGLSCSLNVNLKACMGCCAACAVLVILRRVLLTLHAGVDRTPRASQGFVKQMLDVADNLERAAGAVPATALGGDQEVDAAEVQKQLRTLLEGVKMTQQVLNQVTPRSPPHLELVLRVKSTRLRFCKILKFASAVTGFQTQWRRTLPSRGGDIRP